MSEKPSPPKKSYPAVYEKIVPIVLGILGVVVIAMLIYTVLVGVGVIQFN